MTSKIPFLKRKSTWIIAAILISLCIICTVVGMIYNATPQGKATATARAEESNTAQAVALIPTESFTPSPTKTASPTNTPRPSNTPPQPTHTPDPNLLSSGTYLVGTDIRPGFYKGFAFGTGLLGSCYWARLANLSGELDAINANDNAIGQYYVEVTENDFAFETACDMFYLETKPTPMAEFPSIINPGTYLIGIDIQPGMYRGQTGDDFTDSCYWARLGNVRGDLDGILANDNANGQYYVEVSPSDFAFHTACELEFVQN